MNCFTRFIAIGFFLFASYAAFGQSKEQRIDAFVKAEMEKLHIPGVAVAVIRSGKTELLKGYGLANIKRKTAKEF